MEGTSYTPEPGEKATQVMVGTSDLLIWGDLVTKEQIRVSGFLNTLAEDFVPLHNAKLEDETLTLNVAKSLHARNWLIRVICAS